MATLTKTYVADWTSDSIWVTRIPTQLAQDSFLYVQEIGKFHCGPQYYTVHARMNSFLLLLTLSGNGTYERDGKTQVVAPRDLIFTECGQRQVYKTQGDRWDIAWVHFNGPSAAAYYEQYAAAHAPVWHLSESSRIPVLWENVLAICEENAPSCELKANEALTSLLTTVLLETETVPDDSAALPSFVRDALRDINGHLSEDLSLDHFAASLCVNKYHFQKEFKRCMGITPNEYVRRARINCAKSLLVYTHLSIAEIAARSGFQTLANFNKTFKRLVETTPSQYRHSAPITGARSDDP